MDHSSLKRVRVSKGVYKRRGKKRTRSHVEKGDSTREELKKHEEGIERYRDEVGST